MQIDYTITPIFAPISRGISQLSIESSINVSDHCSPVELFKSIKQKEHSVADQLLPIGLKDKDQLLDFTSNEKLSPVSSIHLFQCINDPTESKQSSIFHNLFQQILNRNTVHIEHNGEHAISGLYHAMKSICHPEHFQNCLFIHMYKTTDQNISQIISLNIDENQVTLNTIKKIVQDTLKQESTNNFIFIQQGAEIRDDELVLQRNYPFITVIDCPLERELNEISSPMFDLRFYELLIRLSIYSILFTQENQTNLQRFFSYCDQDKSFTFKTR
ncbi:unnamed protein product, partial [Adineta ricciae]